MAIAKAIGVGRSTLYRARENIPAPLATASSPRPAGAADPSAGQNGAAR
ncbi:hypothetical protein ACFFMN_28160 [Planobispora siamensis]|nr:hypothetical protein [Planobispora siamensis]